MKLAHKALKVNKAQLVRMAQMVLMAKMVKMAKTVKRHTLVAMVTGGLVIKTLVSRLKVQKASKDNRVKLALKALKVNKVQPDKMAQMALMVKMVKMVKMVQTAKLHTLVLTATGGLVNKIQASKPRGHKVNKDNRAKPVLKVIPVCLLFPQKLMKMVI